MEKKNFDIFEREAIRQFEEQRDILKSHSHLAEVLFGFVVGFLIYFMDWDVLSKNKLFIIPILEILCSGFLAFMAYRVRDFYMGMDLDESIRYSRNNPRKDFRVVRLKHINIANNKNLATIKNKSKMIKLGYLFYFIGILSFTSIKFIYFILS